jgi:cell division protein FtsW (lipid II flippase)
MDLIKDLFKGDKVIWIIFLFLCLISIVEVFSAASTLTYKSGDHWGPITQHSVILMVGVCIVVLNTSTIEIRKRNRKIIQITLSPLNKSFIRSIIYIP